MAGHSKWANIKHKKMREDAKKGRIFTKVAREIIVAARLGGGDPESNPRLRRAIQLAKSVNMPKENIERAIRRGTGELPGVTYEEVVYEGYGPGGVAIMVEAITDNRNRTVSEIRTIFSKHGGSLGETGCVSWIFERKGIIRIPEDAVSEDELMEVAIEAGAEDVKTEDGLYQVITSFEDYDAVKKAIESRGIPIESSEITYIPQNTVRVEGEKAEKLLKLLEALEAHDDVQNAYANFDIPDEVLAGFSE
ncbi:MAG: YebC/PmpR family DNA-binding transcriptional regulator [Deferribacteres bacterium]|nr:YebC/PmpR family DNA-binding transcriptional regulator [Deferribacteres bacterium]